MKNSQHYMPGVVIWGVVAGILSGIPCVYIVNCCFCLYVVLGGMFAVNSVNKKAGQSIEAGEGAIIGLLVGLMCTLIGGTLLFVSQYFLADMNANNPLLRQLAQNPKFQGLAQAQAQQDPLKSALSLCCFFGGAFPVFGALGGLIGSAVFKKSNPPNDGMSSGGGFGGGGFPQQGGGFGGQAPIPMGGPGSFGQQGPQNPQGGGFGGPYSS